MKFDWHRMGKVFDPQTHSRVEWMQEFAQCPTPISHNDHIVRVYFATRPARDSSGLYVSRPGFVELDRHDLTRVVRVSDRPSLQLGQRGAFDEFGIMPSSVVRHGNRFYMYYTGWTRMESVPYVTGIGLAVSDDGETFCRLGDGPVVSLSLQEPYMVNSPIVRCVGETWHMWYVSGVEWIVGGDGPEIVFQHAYSRSKDGVNWPDRTIRIMPTLSEDECQDLLCPILIGDSWHAFFSYRNATGFRTDRSRAYRLGHAISDDSIHWKRTTGANCLARSDVGWDSQMICSTQFLEMDGRRWMFYCGNDFGRAGFGIAELNISA